MEHLLSITSNGYTYVIYSEWGIKPKPAQHQENNYQTH